ncbi:MAG: monovalent cation/H+ antiporter complex subunit F [Candidatus Omnitrophota bacterium]
MRFTRWFLGSLLLAAVTLAVFAILPVTAMAKLMLYLLLCFLLSLWRILRGPTAADRSVATDILGILVVGFCALLAISTGKDWYIDIAIAWSLQSFIGTLALAKFLEGKNFDE